MTPRDRVSRVASRNPSKKPERSRVRRDVGERPYRLPFLFLQPRTELARVRTAGSCARRGQEPAAARAGEVRGDHGDAPRRVLHEADERAEAPDQEGGAKALDRRTPPDRGAEGLPRGAPAPGAD